jgi:multidrug efflux system membrane fusion protein
LIEGPSSSLRSRKGYAALGIVIVALAGGWTYWHAHAARTAQADRNAGPQPVPVGTYTARKGDFPVYLDGLGTVQPYDTVTVRSRVDGQVTKVSFRQGQIVRQGDVLVEIDPRPFQAALDQAKAKKAQDEASLANAKLDLERYSTLAEQNFASRQQLDTQKTTVATLTAQIEGDQANIDNATTQLSYTTIRSPLTGKTGFRLIDPGNIVHAADTNGIVTIVKLQPISVVFTAPEEQVGPINDALARGTVPVTVLSSDGTKILANGHLSIVDNQVDTASGTIRMKATFANKDNALWPGLAVSTRLLVNTRKDSIAVPNNAIQHGPNGLYVFVVGSGNKVEMRPIKVAEEGDDRTVVTSGIQAGDTVVVSGQYRLNNGTLVVARNAGATAPAKTSAAADGKQADNVTGAQ